MGMSMNKTADYALGYLEGVVESSWTCIDCGNIYESLVSECPNTILDEANVRYRSAKRESSDGE